MEENLKQLQLPGNDIIKIAIYGSESTGKTTLSKQLADYFKTEWAPEFARDYLQEKWDSKKDPNCWTPVKKRRPDGSRVTQALRVLHFFK